MESLISVVVPIYNVEPFLTDCLDSLVNQTYRRLEIILVNDGSPDGCGAICDRYAAMDERVRVIHKENGGLSDARNTGLRQATGDYVCFIDSDDWIDSGMIRKLYDACRMHNADVGACFFSRVEGQEGVVAAVQTAPAAKVYTGRDVVRMVYEGRAEQIAFTACNKLYRREMFEAFAIEYPVGKYHEDIFTTYRLLYGSARVAVVEQELYFYRVRGGSIMTQPFTRRRIDALEAYGQAVQFFEDAGDNLLQSLAWNAFCSVSLRLYARARRLRDKAERDFCLQTIHAMFQEAWHLYGYKVPLPPKKTVAYALFRACPGAMSGLLGSRN